MQIDIQTRGFRLTEGLRTQAERRVRFALGSTSGRVRSVVMRLADENGPRGGVDKRCTIRANLPGGPPVIIEQQEADLYVAIDRAADRAARAVSRRLERASGGRRDAPSAGNAGLDHRVIKRDYRESNVESIGTWWMWVGFTAIVLVMLAIDLFVVGGGKQHRVSMREAATWSGIWVGVSFVFAGALWWYLDGAAGTRRRQ